MIMSVLDISLKFTKKDSFTTEALWGDPSGATNSNTWDFLQNHPLYMDLQVWVPNGTRFLRDLTAAPLGRSSQWVLNGIPFLSVTVSLPSCWYHHICSITNIMSCPPKRDLQQIPLPPFFPSIFSPSPKSWKRIITYKSHTILLTKNIRYQLIR